MNSQALNIESIKELQKKLSDLLGVSGHEEEVRTFIFEEIENRGLADKSWIDPLGNVLAVKEGTIKQNRILLDAHIDEIGFMISHIDKKGFLRFVSIGGWDKRILLGQPVILKSGDGQVFHGIIGSKPPHLTTIEERKKVVNIPKMYIDIGMRSEEEVINNQINIGTLGTLFSPFVEFPNGMVRGKAFDDRTGCNVLLHTMMLLKEIEHQDTVLFNFAVQEEVGGFGAMTGAYELKPTGKGPAITVADRSLISNPKVNKRLIKNAEIDNITYQYKKPRYGGTDAGKIQFSRRGVPSTVVSVPCRYIHSPTSLLKLEDILATIKLLETFIRNPAKV